MESIKAKTLHLDSVEENVAPKKRSKKRFFWR
jgi:hypothetical protein